MLNMLVIFLIIADRLKEYPLKKIIKEQKNSITHHSLLVIICFVF